MNYLRPFTGFDRLFSNPWPNSWLEEEKLFSPAVDVEETDKSFLIDIDLPGVKKDQVEVKLEGKTLRVSAHRKEEKTGKEKGYRYRERFNGTFERSFTLPEHIDGEKIQAEYKDGVLKLNLPKTEKTLPRKIEIAAA